LKSTSHTDHNGSNLQPGISISFLA